MIRKCHARGGGSPDHVIVCDNVSIHIPHEAGTHSFGNLLDIQAEKRALLGQVGDLDEAGGSLFVDLDICLFFRG